MRTILFSLTPAKRSCHCADSGCAPAEADSLGCWLQLTSGAAAVPDLGVDHGGDPGPCAGCVLQATLRFTRPDTAAAEPCTDPNPGAIDLGPKPSAGGRALPVALALCAIVAAAAAG